MGSINALPNYIRYFGLPENGNASTGIVFAIFQVKELPAQSLRAILISVIRLVKCAVHYSSGWPIGMDEPGTSSSAAWVSASAPL